MLPSIDTPVHGYQLPGEPEAVAGQTRRQPLPARRASARLLEVRLSGTSLPSSDITRNNVEERPSRLRSRLSEILAAGSDLTGGDRGGLRCTAFCFHLFTVVHVFVGVDLSDGGGGKKIKSSGLPRMLLSSSAVQIVSHKQTNNQQKCHCSPAETTATSSGCLFPV